VKKVAVNDAAYLQDTDARFEDEEIEETSENRKKERVSFTFFLFTNCVKHFPWEFCTAANIFGLLLQLCCHLILLVFRIRDGTGQHF